MVYIFLGILGLVIGSYANVVIFRLARHESPQRGRSRCLHCGETIRWYDNIPIVSFLLLSGKCRFCHAKLSWQYPLLELGMGIGFAASGAVVLGRFGSSHEAYLILGWMLVTLVLLALISVYDLKHMEIPIVFLWLANGSTLIFLLAYQWGGFHTHWLFPHTLTSSLFGALTSGGFLFILVYFSRETWMGWGDVWLGTWAGLIIGLALVELYLTLSFILGACVGLWLLFRERKQLKSEIPFAPYLLLSLVIIFLVEWYRPEVFSFLLPWFPATM